MVEERAPGPGGIGAGASGSVASEGHRSATGTSATGTSATGTSATGTSASVTSADGSAESPRLLPPRALAFAIGTQVVLHLLMPLATPVAGAGRLVGALVLLLGLALTVAGSQHFVRHGTAIRPFDAARLLVTDGPFAYSRNPMYLGMILMLSGIAAALGSLTPWLLPPLFALWLQRAFVRREEAALAARFPEAWAAYAARVRRWL